MTDNQDNPPSQPATKPKKSAPKAKMKPKGKPAPKKTPKPKAKGKTKSRKPSASPQEDRDTVANPSTERAGLFTVELGARICRHLADGETLNQVCRRPWMPSPACVRAWALDETGSLGSFPAQFARAREIGWSHQADLILEFSDSSWGTRLIFDHQRARIASEDRRWILARWLPKVYGDRLETTVNAKVEVKGDGPFDEMGVARFIHLQIEREGLLDKDGRPTKKGIILYLQDGQRRGLDLDEPVPTNGIALSPQLQGTSPQPRRSLTSRRSRPSRRQRQSLPFDHQTHAASDGRSAPSRRLPSPLRASCARTNGGHLSRSRR